jgi:hypothetical protein
VTEKPTREQVLAEPAERRLDEWVAEHVMGQTWQGGSPIPNYDGRWSWPPPYSTDIAAAWEVVTHMEAVFPGFDLIDWPVDGPEKRWYASFGNNLYPPKRIADFEGPTPEICICKAALLAVV